MTTRPLSPRDILTAFAAIVLRWFCGPNVIYVVHGSVRHEGPLAFPTEFARNVTEIYDRIDKTKPAEVRP